MSRKMIKKGDLFAINYASLHCWDKIRGYLESPNGEDSIYKNEYIEFKDI